MWFIMFTCLSSFKKKKNLFIKAYSVPIFPLIMRNDVPSEKGMKECLFLAVNWYVPSCNTWSSIVRARKKRREQGLLMLKLVWVSKGHQCDLYLQTSENTVFCCYNAGISTWFNKIKLFLKVISYRITERESSIYLLFPGSE